ncbi:DUF2188 domain-containing protein [Ancylobacter amanitiformis]|uniref:DUF2188 domain-containing protein n=1 Tax=Ancylobacter amanitiformis TaxID=217069 RepID=A0ABU0LMF1_9HYPH|nr:DUF2188 domain-containing protein [Ancylobacter amanitiformis]MDQ0509838.1 hypothetical protein [Ancylobacter amanitiformis]
MSQIHYVIVPHDEGWAYRLGDVYSETFTTHDAALKAARHAAARQSLPDETRRIQYQDKAGKWHEETALGGDRPQAEVDDIPPR